MSVCDKEFGNPGLLPPMPTPTLQEIPAFSDDGSVTVNGVNVPRLVAELIRNAGIPIEFLSTGQLRAAIDACAVDCNLIDDPKGTDFLDSLNVDLLEAEEEKECQESLPSGGFCEKIKEERERKKRALLHPEAEPSAECAAVK